MAGSVEHSGRWTPEVRFGGVLQYLPVEVPPGACALRVELEYDRSWGAVLDLGCLGAAGFRGWSGSARRSFVVAADAATPGYLPGELEPGLWQVMIGVHHIPPRGVDYRVTARTSSSAPAGVPVADPPPVPSARPARRLPAGSGRRWLACDLHTHTVHSDGALTVSELAALAVSSGLDVVAITDHNTVSHHLELAAASARYGVVLVPGQEITTDGGHAGALGDVGWIDFRLPADGWLDAVEGAGGLLSVNHPLAGPASWIHPMRRRPPLVEVWHWSWLDLRWTTQLAWWLAWDPAAVPVGGSDWHRDGSDAPLGSPTTWVECADVCSGAVLDGLRDGRVAISATRDGPVLLRHDGDLVAVYADGLTLASIDGPYARVSGDLARFPGIPGHHRLLDGEGATQALTPLVGGWCWFWGWRGGAG